MRKKEGLFLLIIVIMSLASLSTAFSGGGSGNSTDPFEITNCTQLQEMEDNYTAHYILTQNINCSDTVNWNSGSGFEPIGNNSDTFNGTFNGQGYYITNLYINKSASSEVGLFGYAIFSKIENVGLKDVNITGRSILGSLVGGADKTNITNCYATGYLEAVGIGTNAWMGGLVGWIENASLIDSYFIGVVEGNGKNVVGGITSYPFYANLINSSFTGNVSGNFYVGGLVGILDYTDLINSSFTGNVNGNNDYVGGLVGYSGSWAGGSSVSNVIDSYAVGNVNGNNDYVGGLVGYFNQISTYSGYITGSHFTGNVSGNSYVGGLAGEIDYNAYINNSYVVANISGTSDVGGLAGGLWKGINIENSYMRGNIISAGDWVGGLAGWNGWALDIGGNITNCYAIVDIIAPSEDYIGGLVGHNYKGIINNSYAVGNFSGSNYVGGLLGYNEEGSIFNSFSAVTIYGTSTYVGGLAGHNSSGTINNSYWYNSTDDDIGNCYQDGNDGCTAVTATSYLFNQNNVPMISWSYPPWDTICDDNGYPSLASENIASASYCVGYTVPVTSPPEEEEDLPSPGADYPIYLMSEKDMKEGYEKRVAKNWKITFRINGEEHSILVDEITENTTTLIIKSDEKIVTISINKTKKVDVDGNGFYDLQIFLKEIILNKAEIVITSIYEEILEEILEEIPEKLECDVDTDCPDGQECVNNLCEEELKNNTLGIIIGIVLIIVTTIIIWFDYFKKRIKKLLSKL